MWIDFVDGKRATQGPPEIIFGIQLAREQLGNAFRQTCSILSAFKGLVTSIGAQVLQEAFLLFAVEGSKPALFAIASSLSVKSVDARAGREVDRSGADSAALDCLLAWLRKRGALVGEDISRIDPWKLAFEARDRR